MSTRAGEVHTASAAAAYACGAPVVGGVAQIADQLQQLAPIHRRRVRQGLLGPALAVAVRADGGRSPNGCPERCTSMSWSGSSCRRAASRSSAWRTGSPETSRSTTPGAAHR